MTAADRRTTVEAVFREVYGQALATLVRIFGDIDRAEDAVQDAFAVAVDRWRETVPPNPAGWIITTAKRRAIDTQRRETRGRELLGEVGRSEAAATPPADQEVDEETLVQDDQLRLIFTCCHPALRSEHQIALTLRLLGGLEVDEIARAFLVGESAMAKRLVRAKYKIKAAKIPYRVPSDADLPDRLQSVLAVLYLIYNAGADDRARALLRADAIRLARALAALMPDEPEAAGLVALMILNEARMPARITDRGIAVLRDQDRAAWDRGLIEQGHEIVHACIRRDRPGPYQLQAAIQAVHCAARSFEATDWPQIVTLYDHLLTFTPTPVVALNRAIAVGEVDGPEAALGSLDDLAAPLDSYHLFHATHATMLRRLGRIADARTAFTRAASLASTVEDQQFLRDEIASLDSEGSAQPN